MTVAAVLTAMAIGIPGADGPGVPTLAARAQGVSEIHKWNEIMTATAANLNPFAEARAAAVVQLAVFEAVNAITGEYEPYGLDIQAPAGASPEAAAAAAAHGVLKAYFTGAAAFLDAKLAESLAWIGQGQATDDGVAVGQAAALLMIAARASDGSAPPLFHLPSSTEPGEWQLTPSCSTAGGALAHWSGVVPFGVPSVEAFQSAPPPPLESDKYALDYLEVMRLGGANSALRPADRSDVARFYSAVAAVGTWNQAVRRVAEASGTSLSESAQLYALLNMAMSDALVAAMDTKYHYRFWRPETAIAAGGADGNPATEPATFVPFIRAPCFPGYGSAHAASANAARRVAERLLGVQFPEITLSSSRIPEVALQYTSFKAITADIDDARVYGGIHFRFDQEAGGLQGRRIGDWILSHLLKPRTEP